MRSVSIFSAAGLLALAAAQPAAVTVTKVKTVITTIDVTKTVYAGEAQATPVAQGTPIHHQPPVHHHHQHHSHHHHHSSSTYQPPPPPPPSSTQQAPPPPSSTYTPPPPPPSTTYNPPPPPPTNTASPPAGGVPAYAKSGQGTFYTPGLGSCGITNTETDHIVALSLEDMGNGANPNTNPKCGQMIHIVYQGKHHTAIVTDSCYACVSGDVDMTPTLFQEFASLSEGRIDDVEWWFDDSSFN